MAKIEIVEGRCVFNVDVEVGKGRPNRIDDVELVRYGYTCLKSDTRFQVNITPRLRAALQKLNPRGAHANDLQEVIEAHQEARGGQIDGIVSVGKSQSMHTILYDRKHAWIIYSLSGFIRDNDPDLYPRIDLDESCGSELRKKVKTIFFAD